MDLFKHPKYIPGKLCYLSREDAVILFKNVFEKFAGFAGEKETIAIYLAHCALETGTFAVGLHNWNWGNTRCNIDKLKEDQYFTMFRCNEVINGKIIWYNPGELGSVFEAFQTPEDGLYNHFRFIIKERYWGAWESALAGNPVQYVKKLKEGGYFTADLNRYTNTFISLYYQFLKELDK
jgi:hypothetical protein